MMMRVASWKLTLHLEHTHPGARPESDTSALRRYRRMQMDQAIVRDRERHQTQWLRNGGSRVR